MATIITYKPFGRKAILIEWKPIIALEILNDIILFKDKITTQNSGFYLDFSIGYNSLTILFKENILNFQQEIETLQKIYSLKIKSLKTQNFLWEIPVCYDLEFGIDLKEMSNLSNLDISKIIEIHSKNVYTVFFIGFLPGFLYLGGLNPMVFFDRKSNPRLHVEKGSVGIGGVQTGIYPISSAGGWNIIGKSPINFFDVDKEIPCFAKSGDQIKFNQISKEEFYDIEKLVLVNKYQLLKTIIHD